MVIYDENPFLWDTNKHDLERSLIIQCTGHLRGRHLGYAIGRENENCLGCFVTGSGDTMSMGRQGKPVSKGASNNCQSKEKDEAWGGGHETHREYSREGSTFVMRVLGCVRRLGKVQLPRRYVEQLPEARIGGRKSSKSPNARANKVWMTMWGNTHSR